MGRNRFMSAAAALLSLASVMAAALTAEVYAQRPKLTNNRLRSQNPAAKGAEVKYAPPRLVVMNAFNDVTPVFPVVIDSELTLDPATQALYQQMATRLSGYAQVRHICYIRGS